MSEPVIALQLYTLRDLLVDDFAGTLRAVREIGYEYVQLCAPLPEGAQETRKILDTIGLLPAGVHVDMDSLDEKFDYWMSFADSVGTRDLIVPYLAEELRQTHEDWLAVAARLDALGARCKAAGIRLSYHNHSFEFEARFDGAPALDLLYANAAPDHLYAEIDTYWVQHGGCDPVDYILKYAGRLPILHVKDMTAGDEPTFAEIGQGILDWPAIIKAARASGVEYLCVEQDRCPGDPLESVRVSYDYLSDLMGLAT